MTSKKHLVELAGHIGLLPGYIDDRGRRVETSEAARARVLGILGYDVSSEASCRETLERLRAEERARLVPPVRFVREGTAAAMSLRAGARLTIRPDEGGEPIHLEGKRLVLPALAAGYYDVEVESGERHARQRLIVSPARCLQLEELTDKPQLAGLWANLYTARSADNWGVGDLTDLARLGERAAAAGADFLGVNPLHALHNRGWDISPYSPVSRLFRNPLYIDVARVPEARHARALLESPDVRAAIERARGADAVAYPEIAALKRRVLRVCFDALEDRGPLERFRTEGGRTLTDFCTFVALGAHLEQTDWRRWPEEYRSPRAPAVERFRREHARDVELELYLQMQIDRQLAEAAERCRNAGMAVGLYQDLAVGTAPSGCDVWAWPELFLPGLSMGAPPDSLGPNGQVWGLVPMSPRVLSASGYDFWVRLLRGALAHSGALRIDHAIGLTRQFWVPDGEPGSAGVYIQFPLDELLAVAAIESRRARALVIGEDLGTVPPGLQSMLARFGVLSSRVMMFERKFGGEFKSPGDYSKRALVTANTHDLAPLAGFVQGRDLALRRDVGDMDAASVAGALRAREQDRKKLIERLNASRVLSTLEPSPAQLVAAAHQFLRRTPAPLVGFGLDDLAGETEPVNLPGVTLERYPSWSRRMRLPIEELPLDIPPAPKRRPR